MKHVKTAVSLDRRLYEKGEALASELKNSRSRLFALDVKRWLLRHEGMSA